MRGLLVSLALGAAMAMTAGVAQAQPGLSGGNDLDAIDRSHRLDQEKERLRESTRKTGLAALQAGDFTAAERSFAALLTYDPTTSDASYLMGLAQLGQEKWQEAKLSLQAAVANEPTRPEPKARLGVAHVMLGDINSAADQHDALSAMWNACNRCENAQAIADSLTMLDRVLVAATKPKSKPPG